MKNFFENKKPVEAIAFDKQTDEFAFAIKTLRDMETLKSQMWVYLCEEYEQFEQLVYKNEYCDEFMLEYISGYNYLSSHFDFKFIKELSGDKLMNYRNIFKANGKFWDKKDFLQSELDVLGVA